MQDVAYQQFEQLEDEHWWFRGRRAVFFDQLDRLLPRRRPLRSLDVGCGYGGMMLELARFGPTIGADVFPEALRTCRLRDAGPVVLASASPLPVAADSFEVVTFFDCIEHLDDDLAALREGHRVLRPGGHVVVTVPAYNFLYANNDRVVLHKRRYTVGGLRSKLEASGFEVRKATYVNTLLFPVILPAVLAKKARERLRPVAGDQTTNLTHSPGRLNAVLCGIFSSERVLLRRMSFPFGHSIFAVATKRAG